MLPWKKVKMKAIEMKLAAVTVEEVISMANLL